MLAWVLARLRACVPVCLGTRVLWGWARARAGGCARVRVWVRACVCAHGLARMARLRVCVWQEFVQFSFNFPRFLFIQIYCLDVPLGRKRARGRQKGAGQKVTKNVKKGTKSDRK